MKTIQTSTELFNILNSATKDYFKALLSISKEYVDFDTAAIILGLSDVEVAEMTWSVEDNRIPCYCIGWEDTWGCCYKRSELGGR